MEEMTAQKPWQYKFIEIYESLPESEGFVAEIADKQIEGIFDLILLMSTRLIQIEELMGNLTGGVKEKLEEIINTGKEEDYTPSKTNKDVETIYM